LQFVAGKIRKSNAVRLQKSAGEVKSTPPSSSPAQFGGVSTPLTANVPCTPHQAPAGLTAGWSRHADTIDHVHTRTTGVTDLCDHAVRLKKRRASVIACADVATAKAKAATAINLIIVFSHA
jgi:hypothetical protein